MRSGPGNRAVLAVLIAVWLISVTSVNSVFTATTSNNAASATAVNLNQFIPATASTTRISSAVCRVSWTASATANPPNNLTYDVTDGTSTQASGIAGLTTDLSTSADITPTVLARTGSWVSSSSRTAAASCQSAPDAPPSVIVTPSDKQLAISWTAPNNHGAAITGYSVTATAGTSSTCTTSGATTCTITGLTNGFWYQVTVTATNVWGTSVASTAVLGIPYPSGIMTAARLMLWLDGADTATLFQDTAATTRTTTAGQSIARWNDKSGRTDGSGINYATAASSSVRPTLTNVNGHPTPTYDGGDELNLRTGALLPTGTSSGVIATVATSTDPTPGSSDYRTVYEHGSAIQGQIRGVYVKNYDAGQIFADSYAVQATYDSVPYSSTPATVFATWAATVLTLNANSRPGITATYGYNTGSTYGVIGSAWLGTIPELIEFTGTLTTAERRIVEEYLTRKWNAVITPAAPAITATTVQSTTSVKLTWTAPTFNGGSAVTGYTVTASPGGATCTTSTLTCTVTGLTHNTAYTFTVTATNSVGVGPASASTSATP